MSAETPYSKIIIAFQHLYQELRHVDPVILLEAKEPPLKIISHENFKHTEYD